MKQLKSTCDLSRTLTAYLYCRVFPLEKTKEGFYRCRLSYEHEDKENPLTWIIPVEYLSDNGRVEVNQDIYFCRWRIRNYSVLNLNEKGEMMLRQYGNESSLGLCLGRLIEFWNTRVFGLSPDV